MAAKYRIRFSVSGGDVTCSLHVLPGRGSVTSWQCGVFTIRRGSEFRALMDACSGIEFVGAIGSTSDACDNDWTNQKTATV